MMSKAAVRTYSDNKTDIHLFIVQFVMADVMDITT